MVTTHRIALSLALIAAAVVAPACEAQSGMTDDELRVMIDSLLPSIAEVSGMAVRRPVQFSMQSRADARRFIEDQLDEELGPEQLDGMERAYKAFGLLPDTLDLRAMLLDLYTEQVVGYYDPATDRLYVLDEATAATAGPVVAHELVHALQDQHTDLDSLVAGERGNDRQMAAQAAAEGQATLVMVALQAARMSGRSVDFAALPDLSELLGPALEAENEQFPVFRRAPRLVRETLLFPYMAGAGFVQALFRAREGEGLPVPFGDRLPQSTEQVMAPEVRFLDERDAPTEVRLGPAGGGWEVVYSNVLGQLETSIMMTELLGERGGDAALGWDGDRYALLRGPDGGQALVWYSVWDDAAAADAFAELFRTTEAVRTVERLDHDGRPMIRVTIPGDALPGPAVPVVADLVEG
ncbi:MAG: hypothetical protein ACN0LA_00335 [Candidatus Longimicrobiales bacterium M2_2A_002]